MSKFCVGSFPRRYNSFTRVIDSSVLKNRKLDSVPFIGSPWKNLRGKVVSRVPSMTCPFKILVTFNFPSIYDQLYFSIKQSLNENILLLENISM